MLKRKMAHTHLLPLQVLENEPIHYACEDEKFVRPSEVFGTGDLEPENILIDRQDRVRPGDYTNITGSQFEECIPRNAS